MAAAGEALPEPGDLDAPLPDWLAPEEGEAPAEPVRLLVPVEAPGRAVRVTISMDEGLVARLDAAATRRTMSRSAFLAEAVRSALSRRRRRPERRPVGWTPLERRGARLPRLSGATMRGSKEPITH